MSDPLSREAFDRFFRRKFGVLWRAAFDPRQRRPRYRKPEVIAAIAAPYRALAPSAAPHPFPRHIYMQWQQGWDAAPALVKACAESWRRHNPTWEFHFLDEDTIPKFADDIVAPPGIHRVHQSDIARLNLMHGLGGVWADTTVFCTRPLDDWLPHVATSGLFMFAEPRPYRYVDVWFIAATAGNPVVAKWHDMARRYWQTFSKPHHYYWLPYVFEYLAEVHPEVMAAWQAVPKLSALGPLAVQGNPFDRNAPRAIFDLIAENRVPLHKLSHKWLHSGTLAGTPVGALTGMERLRADH